MKKMKLLVQSVLATTMLIPLFMQAARADDDAFLNRLQVEKRRQTQLAQQCQENILALTKNAAALGAELAPGESLLRDVNMAEAELVRLQAKLSAIQERMVKPNSIPSEVLIQMNPDLVTLTKDREEISQRKEKYLALISRDDHPRIRQFDAQIRQIDENLLKMTSGEGREMMEKLNALRLNEKMAEWTLQQDIRAQELYVQELKKRYDKQIAESIQRAESTVGALFDQAHLDRINKTIDAIDAKVLELGKKQGEITDAPADPNQALLLRLIETLERIESRLDAQQPQRQVPMPSQRGGRFR